MLKLPLKSSVWHRANGFPWESCAPFVDNSQALLLHRPRRVTMFKNRGTRHLAVEGWCGNTATGDTKFTFTDTYAGAKMLCLRCEENAVKAGLPPADELLGHHIHKGKLIAVRTCCKGATNEN